jgi:hypothetical protein
MRKAIVLFAVGVVIAGAGLAQAAPIISIFKSGAGINNTYVTNEFTDFKTAGAANVVQVTCDDTEFNTNSAGYYNLLGTGTSVGGTSDFAYLVKWDLSSLPAGATITKAQIRLYASNGNNGSVWIAPVVTHDWSQATATVAGPDHPTSPNKTWGPTGTPGYFSQADVGTISTFTGAAVPVANPTVVDVTSDLQAIVNGAKPNYGWAFLGGTTFNNTGPTIGNHAYATQDAVDATVHPALFVEYTPEPATMCLLALGGLALLRRRA